jgi:hypothetical protein
VFRAAVPRLTEQLGQQFEPGARRQDLEPVSEDVVAVALSNKNTNSELFASSRRPICSLSAALYASTPGSSSSRNRCFNSFRSTLLRRPLTPTAATNRAPPRSAAPGKTQKTPANGGCRIRRSGLNPAVIAVVAIPCAAARQRHRQGPLHLALQKAASRSPGRSVLVRLYSAMSVPTLTAAALNFSNCALNVFASCPRLSPSAGPLARM